MKGLILKDIYNVAGTLKVYVVIPILFALLSYMNSSMDMLAFGTCFIGVFIVISCCAYDEMVAFDSYALTLPISRKDLVIAKFVIANIFLIITLLISNVIANLLYIGVGEARFSGFQTMDFLNFTVAATLICSMVSAFLLTVIFKFGTEKGRMIFLVIFLIIGLGGSLLSKLSLPFSIASFMDFLNQYFLIIIAILCVITQIIAMNISIHIMKKKEL